MRFTKGRENIQDDPRCGRPPARKTETIVEPMKKMVRGDGCLTFRLIYNKLIFTQNRVYKNDYRRSGNEESLRVNGAKIVE